MNRQCEGLGQRVKLYTAPERCVLPNFDSNYVKPVVLHDQRFGETVKGIAVALSQVVDGDGGWDRSRPWHLQPTLFLKKKRQMQKCFYISGE